MHLPRILAAVLALATPPLGAQVASSPTYFMLGGEQSPGDVGLSGPWTAASAFGAGVTADRAQSTGFQIVGGFFSTLDVLLPGTPWAAGVRPLFGELHGGSAHTLHGAELALGPQTQVTVDGIVCNVGPRAGDQVGFTLPALLRPGYLDVTVSNQGGLSKLPGGIGVLPLLELPFGPYRNLQPNRVSLRGSAGDLAVFFIAPALGPQIPVPPYEWRFELDYAFFFLLQASVVTSPSGLLHLDVPPVALDGAVWFQAFVLSGGPGYGPGCFTNTVRF